MKRILRFSFFLAYILVNDTVLGKEVQTSQRRQEECYTKYVKRGTQYASTKNFDMAIKQFEAAKYCNSLTYARRKKLDSLITDANKKRIQETKKKSINKKKVSLNPTTNREGTEGPLAFIRQRMVGTLIVRFFFPVSLTEQYFHLSEDYLPAKDLNYQEKATC